MQSRAGTGVAFLLALGVSGCGQLADSRLNPLNLFSRSAEVPVTTTVVGGAEITDRRGLIDQILTLDVAPVAGGAILRATGVADRQGDWDGALVPVESAPGRLTFAFLADDAPRSTGVSTQRSREVTVAVRLSDAELAGVQEITVTAGRNARAVRR